MQKIDHQALYTVRLAGSIDAGLVDWCAPVARRTNTVAPADEETTCFTLLTDQAGIVGVIRHLHGLGIVLLAVERSAGTDADVELVNTVAVTGS